MVLLLNYDAVFINESVLAIYHYLEWRNNYYISQKEFLQLFPKAIVSN